MDQQKITLSNQYESGSGIELLMKQCQIPETVNKIVIDFHRLRFIEIGSVALLLGFITSWKARGININIDANYNSDVCRYLSRINFFEHINVIVEEKFKRHNAGDRFVVFNKIDDSSTGFVDSLSDQIATCIAGANDGESDEFTDQAPVDGYYAAVAYSVSEMIKNVQQHANAIGFVVAQHYPASDKTLIAIVDCGIGVKESFFRAGSKYTVRMTSDLEALKIALEAEVSSKTGNAGPYGATENAGVGLTLLTHVAKQTGGNYQLLSGNGFLQIDQEKTLPSSFHGTFFSLSFNRSMLDDFGRLLENARISVLGKMDNDLDTESEDIFNR